MPAPVGPFPFGARVVLPLNQVGLIVDPGPTTNTRLVAWRHSATGRAMEAVLPTASLAVIALPLPETPKG